jgi:pyridoxal phosphate enzyme (YggS family)
MPITKNLLSLKNTIPDTITLVAVSKTKPLTAIREAYGAGQRIFGENKVQEMAEKWENLPRDIQWHMIGHVQTNKVKYMAPFVSLVHGVDSLKLLKEINTQAKKNMRRIDCLLQIYIAKEESKFGLDENELFALVHSDEMKTFQNINIIGLMGMATFTQNTTLIRQEFKYLKSLFDTLKGTLPEIHVLSMGMSGDYSIAIEEGSTMVRIGSGIFGERD